MFSYSFSENFIYQVVKIRRKNNPEQHTRHWCKCSEWMKSKTPLCSLMSLNYEINGYCDVRPLNIRILHNLITNPFSHGPGVVLLFFFTHPSILWFRKFGNFFHFCSNFLEFEIYK
jgi:hypothetical protein